MSVVQIRDWHIFLRDGEQFLETARSAYLKRRKAFSPEVLYNLTCMGIEKLIMAVLMKNGDLAENHTMGDLLNALERHIGKDPEIAEKLQFLDTFQEICDMDSFIVKQPSAQETARIIRIGTELHTYLTNHLYYRN